MDRISEEEDFPEEEKDYARLIEAIKRIDINDDGIRFNAKMRYIVVCWRIDCQNAVEVKKSLDAIHNATLVDPGMIPKFVMLMSSRTFLTQEIHLKNIRQLFIRKIVKESSQGFEQMQSANPQRFRNTVQLMGEFFYNAKLSGGTQILSLAVPLIAALDMLLTLHNPMDFLMFTNQVYLNGRSLEQVCFANMKNLMDKVRRIISRTDMNYPKECKLLLLLALELSGRSYNLVSLPVYDFYSKELGAKVMAYFKI